MFKFGLKITTMEELDKAMREINQQYNALYNRVIQKPGTDEDKMRELAAAIAKASDSMKKIVKVDNG